MIEKFCWISSHSVLPRSSLHIYLCNCMCSCGCMYRVTTACSREKLKRTSAITRVQRDRSTAAISKSLATPSRESNTKSRTAFAQSFILACVTSSLMRVSYNSAVMGTLLSVYLFFSFLAFIFHFSRERVDWRCSQRHSRWLILYLVTRLTHMFGKSHFGDKIKRYRRKTDYFCNIIGIRRKNVLRSKRNFFFSNGGRILGQLSPYKGILGRIIFVDGC